MKVCRCHQKSIIFRCYGKIFLLCNEFTLMFSGGSGRTIRFKAAVQSGGVMVDLKAALLSFDFCEDIILSQVH